MVVEVFGDEFVLELEVFSDGHMEFLGHVSFIKKCVIRDGYVVDE